MKKSPSCCDVYLVNQLICQNNTGDFFKFLGPFQKSWTLPKQAKGVGACEFLIMFIIAGVWIFQVSSNSQWGNGRNRMMMGWMYKFTLFFMPYSNSHVLKVHGTYYFTFCAMCLVTESKQTPFICIIVYILWDFFLSFNLQPKSNNIPNFCLQLRGN